MKFKYTALGASNQKLEGVLEAESLDLARDQLHKMGLSIVGIEEISVEEASAIEAQRGSPTAKEAGIVTYYFVALNTQGKEVNGTIDARDPSTAYRRLLTEYQFKVLDLYPQDAPDPAAASLKPQFEEWNEGLKAEGIDLTQKAFRKKSDLDEEGEEMSAEVVSEIDHFIINTKKVISQYSTQYSDRFLMEIQNTLGELERIRASNNLKHITKLCNELYELISNPDKIETEGATPNEDYQNTISSLKKSGFITNSFKFVQLHGLQKKLQRFEKLQTLMAKISTFLHRGKAEEIEKKYATKIKKRRAHWLSQLTKSLKTAGEERPTFFLLVSKFFAYASASNTILRRARKQELLKTYAAWKEARKQAKEQKKATPAEKAAESFPPEGIVPEKPKKDFSGFFMEIDSFIGWLLFFYIAYFFLVSFAIEKNVGLSKELVLKTLTTPLIVNISIFLVIAHLAFTLKIRLFRSNFLGSLFLLFFCFGLYTLIIVNF
ncbi:hypothetical protein JXD20_01005 [Candidatus Peregrinibacteria bacterium]|nr:hypothetical protein [Candidatus Peregrinibacteria bacterium]